MHSHRPRQPLALSALVLAGALFAACGSMSSVAGTPPAKAGNDYGKKENWLCRPGHNEACSVDLSAAVLAPDGTATRAAWTANPDAAVDCFYVYPTVSNDPSPNSGMKAGAEERRAAQKQFARFGSECRLFAPLYRQATLAGLRRLLLGQPSGVDPQLAYGDVADAWNHYLRHDNQGRGVILIGHSQGAYVLSELIKNEIEGKPAQRQLISAYLIGANVGVPPGRDSGGQFRQIPLCRSAGQTGCVVSYVSFRDNTAPSAGSLFGRLKDGNTAACTNPAALSGGRGELHSYFPAADNLLGKPFESKSWEALVAKADAPFAAVEMATAECVERDGASYLSVAVKPAYAARGFDIPGDLMVGGKPFPDWGLHLVDVDLAMGNLLALARQQIQAYLRDAR